MYVHTKMQSIATLCTKFSKEQFVSLLNNMTDGQVTTNLKAVFQDNYTRMLCFPNQLLR